MSNHTPDPAHHDPAHHDPARHDPAHEGPIHPDQGTDERIDALARAAGSALRRSAPDDGPARAQRTHRRRQTTRAALAGTAAVAVLALGGLAVANRDDDRHIATVDSVDATDQPPTSPAPGSTSPDTTPTPTTGPVTAPTSTAAPATTGAPPTTGAPTTAAPDTPSTPAPQAVYTVTGSPFEPGAVQTLVDPVDGSEIVTEPIDPVRAQEAQQSLPGGIRSTVDLGDVAYAFDHVVFDGGTLNTEVFPDVDLCGQNVVTVQSPAGSALPARAHTLSISPDDRYVVVVTSTCPEEGTMGEDGVGTELGYEATVLVFDASRPELPGRTLLTGLDGRDVRPATFSGDGRFVAVETFGTAQRLHVVDVETSEEIDVTGGCAASGTTHSRFIGPWVGASSIALVLTCADGQRLLIRDLAEGDELVVRAPGGASSTIRAEVDHGSFDGPSSAWFTLCSTLEPTCWIGHGSDPLVELPGVDDASFLPLGFSVGG